MVVKHIISVFIFSIYLLSGSPVTAQPKFSTVVDPQVVGVHQLVQVEYIIENANAIDDFEPPVFKNFMVLQGPLHSSGMNVTNGNIQEYKTLIFILRPRISGKLKIEGATATVDGKLMHSNSVTIDVRNNDVPVNPAPLSPFTFNQSQEPPEVEGEYILRPGENISDKIKKNLFVKLEVNKTSCYANEPVVATYKLYSRLKSESRVVKHPSFNGFSVYDMINPSGNNPNVEKLNGLDYNVHIIRQSQLFPLQAGTYQLDPAEVENNVTFIKSQDQLDNSLDNLFDPYAETVEQKVSLKSDPVSIQVKPLPTAGQPKNFEGAVGNFVIEGKLKDDKIPQGEITSLDIKLTGKGNIPMISAPSVEWPEGVESFDPSTKEDIHPETVPLSGNKTFVYSFVPKLSGKFIIPPVKFSFFDPELKVYRTDSSQSFSFTVLPTSKSVQKHSPIITTVSEGRSNFFWIISSIVILLLIALGYFLIRYRREKIRIAEKTRQESMIRQSQPLDKARQLLADGNIIAFLKEVENVIWSHALQRFSIPPASLNQSRVIHELEKNNMHSMAELFKELVNDCERNLYVPGQTTENVQEILSKADKFVSGF